MSRLGERAIVIGASMGGLMAARVLTDFYSSVLLLERDRLPASAQNRRGVPQGNHIHLLARRGLMAMSELLPGLPRDLAASGARVWEDGDLTKLDMTIAGHRLVRHGRFRDLHATAVYSASRPLLEFHVRRHVLALKGVTIHPGHEFIDVVFDDDHITGVRVRDKTGGEDKVMSADLVVDAMGRGSRTPVLLERRGYPRPPEDEVMIRLTYCSRVFRMPRETLPEIAIVVGAQPGTTRGMALCACENDTSILTLAAIMGHQPPSALSDMLNEVTELAAPHVVEALRRAEPVGEPARFHTPSSRWRRYDKLHRFPRGLVVTGDAFCSFNPVYGQGMTVAALDALALADALASGENDLAHRFFGRAAKVTRDAWNMAVESDLALSEGPSRRGFAARCSARYTDRVLRCAESNVSVAEQFWKVTNLVVPPTHLLRPGVLLPVAASLFHR